MKRISIDYGRRRIGLAVSDETGSFVAGNRTLECRGTDDCLNSLMREIDRERPRELIFGLPLGPDDEETSMSAEVRGFAEKLHARCGVPVVFIDESYSSRQAEELLRTRRKKIRRNKRSIDRIAASVILDAYLRDCRSL